MLKKYAALLVEYCLNIQEGDRLFIQSTTLAEPLVREVYRAALRAGAALVETDLSFRERNRIFFQEASDVQLCHASPFQRLAFSEFEAYLHIRAPFNLKEDANTEGSKIKKRGEAMQDINKLYAERTADGRMRRSLCQFPTLAAAQEADMSLEEYEEFVFRACKLFEPEPKAAWLAVRAAQQVWVDYLNRCETVRYVADGTDITFSTKGRTWINSDGRANMPSGEIYTSPVEDSVNGVVHFSYPCIHGGQAVEGVTLWVKDGYIEKWSAQRGGDYLNKIFQIDGTRRFGEAAIGANYSIDKMTKNILFDEKIGGTIHMAIGQSYLQAGGKNQSSVHWDMITDMTQGGEIYADGAVIYRNGQFIRNIANPQ